MGNSVIVQKPGALCSVRIIGGGEFAVDSREGLEGNLWEKRFANF